MEINETTMSVYYSCCVFGFAPYTIVRNKLKQIVDFKLNRWMCAYNWTLLLSLCVSSNYALLHDLYSGHAVRMKTPTSRVVHWLDINMVVTSFSIASITAMLSIKNIQRVNNLLRKVDKRLSAFNGEDTLNSKRSKQWINRFLATSSLTLISMQIIDFGAWIRISRKLLTSEYHLNGSSNEQYDSNVYCLIPFYMMYSSFIPLHSKFAVTTYRIAKRYQLLNKAINIYANAQNGPACFRLDGKGTEEIITRFANTYDALRKVTADVAKEFGLSVICLLVSCLLHLVISSYHVFVEILGDKDIFFILLQMMWILFHVGRLTMIIEPCHLLASEAQGTTRIVCDLLKSKSESFVLKHFWKQLLTEQVYFSACGICKIDRQLVTSIFGAIATYLVILLQFQR